MKSCFVAVVLAFVSSVAFAGDAGEPQSVLAQPVPAATVVESAPVAESAVVASAPVAACTGGNCRTERVERSSCRHGFCGRTVERTRTVTRLAAPTRVIRAGRVCRNGICR